MKLHPASPEGFSELPARHQLRVAGIIAGRELLDGVMMWLETGERLFEPSKVYDREQEREAKIRTRVNEYLDQRHLLPDRPL